MSSKKRAVKLIIENRRRESKELGEQTREKLKEEEITPEEHQKRMQVLRDAGLIK